MDFSYFSELINDGKDCWANCGNQQGPCNWCGSKGVCCRVDWSDTSNGCDGTIGGNNIHECVLKPGLLKIVKLRISHYNDNI